MLRIASMDTLITLYFSLGFVQNRFFDRGAMDSLANQLVDISTRARRNPEMPIFQFISIRCSGKQITLPSLIRAKLKRMTVKKKGTLRKILQEAEEKYGKPKENDTRITLRAVKKETAAKKPKN